MMFPGVLQPSAVPGLYATVGRAVTAYAGAVRVAGRNADASSLTCRAASVARSFLPLSGGASKDGDIGNVAAWPLSKPPQMHHPSAASGVAQQVRASRYGCECRGFKSRHRLSPRAVTARWHMRGASQGGKRHRGKP